MDGGRKIFSAHDDDDDGDEEDDGGVGSDIGGNRQCVGWGRAHGRHLPS